MDNLCHFFSSGVASIVDISFVWPKYSPKNMVSKYNYILRWAPLHEGCPHHHGHKGDFKVTPRICGTISERAEVILMWVTAPGVENIFQPQRLEVTRVWL